MNLALKMRMAGGYAIEPFHFVDLVERQLRSLVQSSTNTLDTAPIRILQICTINPHIHTETDNEHIYNMCKVGLGTVYHHLLPLCTSGSVSKLRDEMLDFVQRQLTAEPIPGSLEDEIVPRPRVYPPLDTLDLAMLRQDLNQPGGCGSLRRIGNGWGPVVPRS